MLQLELLCLDIVRMLLPFLGKLAQQLLGAAHRVLCLLEHAFNFKLMGADVLFDELQPLFLLSQFLLLLPQRLNLLSILRAVPKNLLGSHSAGM